MLQGVSCSSLGTANHFEILFSLTQGVVYVYFIPLCTGLWLRKIYEYWHMSFLERGRQALEAAPMSVQVKGTWQSLVTDSSSGPRSKRLSWRLMLTVFESTHLRKKGRRRRKDVSITCPLQSQGSLKATYSPSLLYMPRLILVVFSLVSSWNCILAILSKSLERWRWTYKGKPCQRTGECIQEVT